MNKPESIQPLQTVQDFKADVLAGLQCPRKQLPSKYFYDKRGSQLFIRITQQTEYYLTRAELALMERHVADIAECIGANCMVIEYGSGDSLKTRLLLSHLHQPNSYIPVDIDGVTLEHSVQSLRQQFPWLEILPRCADYTQNFLLPQPHRPPSRKLVYFPGSTIGNLTPPQALEFLQTLRAVCGTSGGALIGVDLKKDIDRLEAAYNDAQGVTAAFNANILVRINRELGANFQLDRFAHHAFYNEELGCIEMHLISLDDQTVVLDGQVIRFKTGETILTEYSYKYDLPGFRQLALQAGFRVDTSWTDPQELFSLHYLTPISA